MKKNSLLHYRLRQILRACSLSLIMFLLPCGRSDAQNVKKLGNGIKNSVYCGCTDSTGNLYVVSKNESTDTTVVYKWSITGKTWTEYARPNEVIMTSHAQFTECFFYKNRFNLSAVMKPDTFYQHVYEYNGSSWNLRGQIQRTGSAIKTVKFNNKVYFTGGCDSAFTGQGRQVMSYDGIKFSGVGFPVTYIVSKGFGPSEADVSSDTIFMTYHNQVLYHKAPSTWGIYYNHWEGLNSVAVVNRQVYAADRSGRLLKIGFNTLKDTVTLGEKRIYLKHFKDRLFVTHAKSDRNNAIRFAEYKANKLTYYFHNNYSDIASMSTLVNYASSNLYYISRDGFEYGGTDFRHVGEIKTDSLTPLKHDTIRLKVFRDENRNYSFDTLTDKEWSFRVYERSNRTTLTTDLLGNLEVYPLENEDYYFVYAGEGQQSLDSCYAPPFSGALGSKVYNSKAAKDTLFFPVWRKSTTARNLVMRSWGSSRARLLDTMVLNLEIFNRDCDNGKANVTVRLTLDPNTTYVSSSPAHSSRTGNEITYSLTNIPSSDKTRISVKIIYPHTKYSVGQKVRHTARLTTAFQEDTLDNTDSIVQNLVYSYDPNAKHSTPEGYITKELKSIRFHIDFQNMGNDDARRVIVVDTLNLKMPVYEFRMVASSHNYGLPALKDNVLTWTFDNINLKPKMFNEEASKGFIIFDAKVRGDLKQGDSIRNKAHIYFDYNPAIETNYSVVIRDDNRNPIEPIHKPYTMIVYPNPAHDYLTVDISYIGSRNITIYDMKGSKIHSMSLHDRLEGRVNTAGWARGIYMVVSDSGESVKVVIE